MSQAASDFARPLGQVLLDHLVRRYPVQATHTEGLRYWYYARCLAAEVEQHWGYAARLSSESYVHGLLKGLYELSVQDAVVLSDLFSTPEPYWLNLQIVKTRASLRKRDVP